MGDSSPPRSARVVRTEGGSRTDWRRGATGSDRRRSRSRGVRFAQGVRGPPSVARDQLVGGPGRGLCPARTERRWQDDNGGGLGGISRARRRRGSRSRPRPRSRRAQPQGSDRHRASVHRYRHVPQCRGDGRPAGRGLPTAARDRRSASPRRPLLRARSAGAQAFRWPASSARRRRRSGGRRRPALLGRAHHRLRSFRPSGRVGPHQGSGSAGQDHLLDHPLHGRAEYLADRVAIIANGRIVAEGPPGQLGAETTSIVTFRLPPDAPPLPAEMASPPAAVDQVVSMSRSDPTQLLHDLTGWALSNGVRLQGLQVAQPSLEDTYLRLTSHGEDSATSP